jgi:HSP20 family molecular chaperone IbpA
MAALTWTALEVLDHLYQHIQADFTGLLNDRTELNLWVGSKDTTWISAVKLADLETEWVLQIQLPEGLNYQNLQVQITPETAVISYQKDEVEGFFSSGRIQNLIPLPMAVHPEAVRVELQTDRLLLILPKTGWLQRQQVTFDFTQHLSPAQTQPPMDVCYLSML